ncbi:PIG-L deacetylase family protein [Bradyrhizobium lablabi]|uniref:PIG-L deacetylase family protein n=1 Tax=Bradyrhizobium lablabi TaxID=722472 RepID=UPI00090B51B3|nr:PIG-L family deacetylase [Bradyrhizobium lablabi]SHM85793.1 GlcNAc-PI de-N-acetylase [Bradyrhizobium lablabi]
MLHIDIILIFLTAIVLIFCVSVVRPKPFLDPPRDVLICAAHSDDCVIQGAEYAVGVIEKSLSVRIVYLTCSGPRPESDIARKRRLEAIAAWQSIGVPNKNLLFIDLVESPVEGPLSYSSQQIADAKKIILAMILALPRGTAVLIPAAGESHVDHQTVRKISLDAIVDSQREDVVVYESPEYNSFLSLIHCPKKTFWTILRYAPSVKKFVRPYAGSSTYVDGGPGLVFANDPRRLSKKKEMLGHFFSQDVALLIHHFGYATPYRKILKPKLVREERKLWAIPAFGSRCDISALAFALSFLTITLLTAYEVSGRLVLAMRSFVTTDIVVMLFGLTIGAVYVRKTAQGTVSLETSLIAWAAALGVFFGTLFAH